ncbi:aminotransferase class IV [Nocardia arizonensis]|uniref:aminotransferase class IV n=1 Tax=Nocardia arizonensis TaxID=1141647 RepID=UPI0006D1F3A8|nr:aminotransferase class IV [Nocardia arizonensis]
MDELFGFDPVDGRLVPADELGAVDVMDSWLVTDGRVRGRDLHEIRFTASVLARHPASGSAVAEFLAEAHPLVPSTGRWFPRIECSRDGELGLRVRRMPQVLTTARIWTATLPDPRSEPTIKGPDQRQLTELRQIAAHFGADEALLTDSDGYVLEGAFSSIGWWRGETLCFPRPDAPILPGVTRRLLETVAGSFGVAVEYERVRPDDLVGLPIWVLSSLHGIREAVRWTGHPDPPPACRSREVWQRALDELATTIEHLTPDTGDIQHA